MSAGRPGRAPGEAWRDVVLMGDPRIASVPVVDDGSPLVDAAERLPFDGREDDGTGAARWVRAGVADRLVVAASALPSGLRLVLNEGYRPPVLQRRYFDDYRDRLARERREADAADLHRLASRFVSPPDVAPHPTGAAVDVLLTDDDGRELDVGCPIDTTPEASGGRCYTAHPGVVGAAAEHRGALVTAMAAAGFTNYPTEWWHWSWGDRYWAFTQGRPAAVHGPVPPPRDLGA